MLHIRCSLSAPLRAHLLAKRRFDRAAWFALALLNFISKKRFTLLNRAFKFHLASSARKFYACNFAIEAFKFTLCQRVAYTASEICGAKIKFTATSYQSAPRRKNRDRYKIFREPSRRRETKFAHSLQRRFAINLSLSSRQSPQCRLNFINLRKVKF